MKNNDIKKILEFVDKAIEGDNIKYVHKIKADVLEIRTSSLFGSREINYEFKVMDEKIYFYSSNNRYEEANELLFFDEMMSQCQDELAQ